MFSLPASVKAEIERAFGQPLKYPADCQRLSLSIRDSLNETIGVTTLKRLFGFVNDVLEPRSSTLDILARYCGFEDYEEMKRRVGGAGDSGFEEDPDIVSASLPPGSTVGFEYMPDRKVTLQYMGEQQFRVTSSEKGSLKRGDLLSIACFSRNKPLIVGSVLRNGENLGRYVAGKLSGLTSLQIEMPEGD